LGATTTKSKVQIVGEHFTPLITMRPNFIPQLVSNRERGYVTKLLMYWPQRNATKQNVFRSECNNLARSHNSPSTKGDQKQHQSQVPK